MSGYATDAELGIDSDRDEREQLRADSPRERHSCTECLDRGCPACWGWGLEGDHEGAPC